MPVIIPPSSRPLLLWLAVAAVCAVLLTAEGVTLLTLWRRPSRPWRLGLATLAGGALAGGLTGRILDAYHELSHISACYAQGCEGFFPLVTDAVAVALILGSLLAVLTIASVVAALILSASEGAGFPGASSSQRHDSGQAITLLMFTLITDTGVYWTIEGVAGWIQTAYLLNPQAAGDGLGQIPLFSAVFETIGGAVVLSMGIALLWRLLRRGEPQPKVV
jgi:hypothetical protein